MIIFSKNQHPIVAPPKVFPTGFSKPILKPLESKTTGSDLSRQKPLDLFLKTTGFILMPLKQDFRNILSCIVCRLNVFRCSLSISSRLL